MQRALRSEINVTPLVDVVLVLLITFMVASPLLHRSYEARLPPTSQPTPPDAANPGTILVSLTERREIYLNKEKMDAASLRIRLRSILGESNRKAVLFSAADGVR